MTESSSRGPAGAEAVEGAADELYGLPPAEFTSARDELARRLRKEGSRDEAAAVKRLRRPTAAAWALNQLARRDREEVERLLRVGERLRAAQRELLAGGGREELQGAAREERELVGRLTRAALELASEAGLPAPRSLSERVAETLRAATLDESTAAELRAGRLTREAEAVGVFGAVGETTEPARERPRRDAPEPERSRQGASREQRRQAPSRERPRRAAPRGERPGASAQARRRELERSLKAAVEGAKRAKRELDAATKAAQSAERSAGSARRRAEEAGAKADAAEVKLGEAQARRAAAEDAHLRAREELARAKRATR